MKLPDIETVELLAPDEELLVVAPVGDTAAVLDFSPDVAEDLDALAVGADANEHDGPVSHRLREARHTWAVRGLAVGVVACLSAGGIPLVKQWWDSTHPEVNRITAVPAQSLTNQLLPSLSPSTPVTDPTAMLNPNMVYNLPKTAPERLVIQKLGIDAIVLPVDSSPTGQKNDMGGDIYEKLDFPVDQNARYWVRRGLLNTLTDVDPNQDYQAADLVELLVHSSDLGHELLGQNLGELAIGDPIIVEGGGYAYEFKITLIGTPSKENLYDDPNLQDLPPNGIKRLALVTCLPKSDNHREIIADLSAVKIISDPNDPAAIPTFAQ